MAHVCRLRRFGDGLLDVPAHLRHQGSRGYRRSLRISNHGYDHSGWHFGPAGVTLTATTWRPCLDLSGAFFDSVIPAFLHGRKGRALLI